MYISIHTNTHVYINLPVPIVSIVYCLKHRREVLEVVNMYNHNISAFLCLCMNNVKDIGVS